jgi:serine/threonine protein phosphatase PrpC
MTRFRISGATHRGTVRDRNEDSFGASGFDPPLDDGAVTSVVVPLGPCIAVVADGLGGHPSGDVASRIAVRTVFGAMPQGGEELVEAIRSADQAVTGAMSQIPGSEGMASTIVAVVLTDDGIAVANVGDSEAIDVLDGRLVTLTTPDVPRDFANFPELASPYLTQVLGGDPSLGEAVPHLHTEGLRTGVRLLLCTDGLTHLVPRAEISDILALDSGAAAVKMLVDEALGAGGTDNITVLLVESL